MQINSNRPILIAILMTLLTLLAVACTPAGPSATTGATETPAGPDVPTADTGQQPTPAGQPITGPAMLGEGDWWLAAIGTDPVDPTVVEPPVSLSFFAAGDQDNQLGFNARAFCNYLGGTVHLDTARTFAIDGQTDFDCESDPLADQDQAVLDAIKDTATLRIVQSDLLLFDQAGTQLLRYRQKPAPTLDPALAGTEWLLTALQDEPPLEDGRITLQFENGSVGGNAGCNSYGAEIRTVDQGTFSISEWAMTAMACAEPEGIMEQETRYGQTLSQVTAYRLEDDTLILLDDAGRLLLTFTRKQETATDPATLVGSGWRLATHNGQPVDVRRPITLILGETRYWGQSECRAYVGTYTATTDDIAFPSSSMLGEPCADEQLLLPESGDYQFLDGRLTLTGPRGDTYAYDPLTSDTALPLAGTGWQLLAFVEGDTPAGIREPLPGTTISATFNAEGSLRGSSGCNTYFATYTLDGNTIAIDEVEVTEEFCGEPESIMDQETRYVRWLEDVGAAVGARSPRPPFHTLGGLLYLPLPGNGARSGGLLYHTP